jgi:hypothetical protein
MISSPVKEAIDKTHRTKAIQPTRPIKEGQNDPPPKPVIEPVHDI